MRVFCFLIAFFGAGISLHRASAQSGFTPAPVAFFNQQELKQSHSPLMATVLSLGLPGAGQVYNRKVWKVPIIYAGLGATGYAIYFNNREYQRYRDGYLARVTGDPDLVQDEFTGTRFTAPVLREFRDFYRSNLELSVLGFAVVYLLNGVDAFVDAHLFEFDVSDDLGMRGQLKPSTQHHGVSLTIGFNPVRNYPVSPF